MLLRTPSHPPLRAAIAVAAAGVLLALGACASHGTTGTGGVIIVGAQSSGAPAAGGGASGGTAGGASKPTGTRATAPATTKKPSGPQIVEFDWKQKPSCPTAPSSDAPFSAPGSQGILEWRTSGGVTSVALSLDSPDFFQQYPGEGSLGVYPADDTFPVSFECDQSPGASQTTTHSYTLDTIGGGKSVEKTITYSAQTFP